jgi:hypothetical protein
MTWLKIWLAVLRTEQTQPQHLAQKSNDANLQMM